MKPRNLLIAAVLLAALSGAVWWSKKHPEAGQSTDTNAPANTTAKLLDMPEGQIQSITLKKKDGSIVALERASGKWTITQPQSYATDQDAVNSLTSSFSPLTADNVVEDKASDFGKYGLASPSLMVTLKTKNGQTKEVELGDEVPAGSLVYARLGTSPKVYAVSSSVKTGLDKSVNDFRDKRLLAFDTTNLTGIELVSPKSDVAFAKSNGNEWQIVKPQPYRADNFQVEELLRKLTDAKMELGSTADVNSQNQASFAAGKPVSTARVTDSSGTQSLEVRQNKDDYFARSSKTDGVYKISSDLGKELDKTLDEFRNKKVFDFGFSDPSRFELSGTIGEKTYLRSGTDWKLNNQVMDPGTVQAFIDKVRDLAATKFLSAGFTSPEFGIAVTSNEGKRVERVEFAKTPDGYLARRGNEPTLYPLDSKAVNDILDASKSIKTAPPAPKK